MEDSYVVSPTIVLSWRDGELIADNYATRRTAAINQDTLTVLSACARPVSAGDLLRALTSDDFSISMTELLDVIESLIGAGLVVRLNDKKAPSIHDNMSWKFWGPEAAYFHFTTKDAPYIEATVDESDYIREILAGDQPPVAKRYPNTIRYPLPHIRRNLGQDFMSVLMNRRTVRDLKNEPISLDDLAQLMDLVFAPKRFVDAGAFGILPLRTYANAGARSELEVYTNILAVSDADKGLYHYNSLEHCLEYLREPLHREDIHHLCYEQPMCDDASAIFFIAARVDRMGHKYRHPRALRAVYLDAGHLGQTFSMVATACGLGAWQTAAFRDSEVECLLGLDGISETVLYCLGVGIPKTSHPGSIDQVATLKAAANSTLFEDDMTFSQ